MSVKPVDFQVMIPRTIDAAKMRSDELQKNLALQQQQASAMKDKAEDTLKQVYSKSQTHEARINEKQREESRQQSEKRKKDGRKGKASDGTDGRKRSSTIKTSTIDIKI
ncbi:MAG: hypothetical protein GX279_04095 [Clostridiaceae bacterium]|jgi:hypothetical protein|nr:hypothetical protein [Clostridiaceae bacterium]